MRIRIISVGRKSGKAVSELSQEYEKRIKSAFKVEWQIIPPADGKMSREQQKDLESKAILKTLSSTDRVVLLDKTGRLMDNKKLAEVLDYWQVHDNQVAFVIGGAYGVNEDVKLRADLILSLSKLVFPHELVRVLLVEQLYRSQAILGGLPYHHD